MTGENPAARVTQFLFFYPRGGSAQVIRYLSASLEHRGTRCDIVSGSLGQPGDSTHAPTFFSGRDVVPIDYTPAVEAWRRGEDPFSQPVPIHPSYEDRPDVPDRVFTALDPQSGEILDASWERVLAERVDGSSTLFHLHHLSPMQGAVRANWPHIPVIGHIHGTELNMLRTCRLVLNVFSRLGIDLVQDAHRLEEIAAGTLDEADDELNEVLGLRIDQWRYAAWWQRRLTDYATLCDRLIVLTDEARWQAADLLGYDAERIHPVPNGVDTELFVPVELPPDERLARWKHWLVKDPHGWDESGEQGSVRYSLEELETWFLDERREATPVLLFVGRFTHMKRVPLLIRAYKRAQARFVRRAPLVIWGGNPGEWEGEHPVRVAREESVPGVFFVGWRGHEELPYGLNSADVMVAPSTNEPFGQVYLEAMACRVPVIATRSGGPLTFVNKRAGRPDGWLVESDDEAELAEALVQAVNDPDERLARGRNALETVRASYSWRQVAGTVQQIYDLTLSEKPIRSQDTGNQ